MIFLCLILYSSFERGPLNVHERQEDIKPRFTLTMSVILDFLLMLASSRFINPCILPNSLFTCPYFFGLSSLKATRTEAFPRYLVRINGSFFQFPHSAVFTSVSALTRACPALIYAFSAYSAPVIRRVLCWRSPPPSDQGSPRPLILTGPPAMPLQMGWGSLRPQRPAHLEHWSPSLDDILGNWDPRMPCSNTHWSFLQGADLPLVCSLLGARSSCYCSAGERVQSLDAKRECPHTCVWPHKGRK